MSGRGKKGKGHKPYVLSATVLTIIALIIFAGYSYTNSNMPSSSPNPSSSPSPTPSFSPSPSGSPSPSPSGSPYPSPTPTPVVSPTPSPSPYPLSFSTSFESGDPASEVSYIEVTPPPSYPQDEYTWGVVTGSQEQSHTGSWSAKCYSQDGGPSGRCRLNVIVDSTTILYARAYFYVAEWHGYIQTMRFWSDHPQDQQSSGAGDYVARITINGGSITAQLGKQSTTYEQIATKSFSTGQWYCIEMMLKIDQANGEFHVWVDNQEITQLTYLGDTYTDWCHYITEVRAGVVLYQQNVDPATLYVDDYAINSERIGL